MEKIISTVWQTIQQEKLFTRGDAIIIGVSGGADSVGLMVILERLNRYYKNNWRIIIAHLNHGIRGRQADADERFVRKLSKELGLAFYAGRRNIPALSRKYGLSLEETARKERYEFFGRIAHKSNAGSNRWPKVAVGHTLDDQAETVLFRIIRGTGIKGLRGILPKRKLAGDSPVYLARPLAQLTHQAIVDFLESQRVGFQLDKTNLDRKILRNRIRWELLPLLREYNPGVVRHLVQLGEAARQNEEVISQAVKRRPVKALSVSELRKEHPVLQVALFSKALKNSGCNLKLITRAHYKSLIRLAASHRPQGEIHLPGGISARVKSGLIRFVKI
jgi:tRNA(Ile)-lysidine synthase